MWGIFVSSPCCVPTGGTSHLYRDQDTRVTPWSGVTRVGVESPWVRRGVSRSLSGGPSRSTGVKGCIHPKVHPVYFPGDPQGPWVCRCQMSDVNHKTLSPNSLTLQCLVQAISDLIDLICLDNLPQSNLFHPNYPVYFSVN